MNKLIMLLGAAILLTATVHMFTTSPSSKLDLDRSQFDTWRTKFSKNYLDSNEELYRFAVFRENLRIIQEHKTKGASYTLGLTEFADLTQSEFRARYLGPKLDTSFVNYSSEPAEPTPAFKLTQTQSVNWTQKNGIVGPVNNQGQCGSCWSFSATEAIQSARAVAGLGLQQLSEQQLVSCSQAYGNQGCNGGWPFWAFNYVMANHPLVLASQYPYSSGNGVTTPCQTSLTANGVGAIKSYQNITNCASLQTALVQQPVSVSVDAANWSALYTGGVFPSSECGTSIDHAVLLVGSTPASSQYPQGIWLIQNSWGASWGENGYIQLQGGNTCAVCTVASIPSAN